MNITLTELTLGANCASDSDPEKCGCGGRGWYLTDFDVWVPCYSHPGRLHPETETGRVAVLRVVNRKGQPVKKIYGETVPCTYEDVKQAKVDARRIQNRVTRYGWKVTLRWETLEDPEPVTAPAPIQTPEVKITVEDVSEYLDTNPDLNRASWGVD